MKVSNKGIAEIFSHEGIVASPYRDSVGVWTIGVGHTAGAGAPNPATMPKGVAIPMSEVIAIFRRDLPKYEAGVNRVLKVPVAQHEFDAMVSFHYNTGGIARAAFVNRLNAGDRAGAAAGIMSWNKPASIIPRRQKEQRLFRDGFYSSNGFASVYPATASGTVQWAKGKRVNVAELLGLTPAPGPMPGPVIVGDPVLRNGDGITRNLHLRPKVAEAQRLLRERGFDPGVEDGKFGAMTENNVMAFQHQRGLFRDGVVGPQTWAALRVAAVPVPIPVPIPEPPPAPVPEPQKGLLEWLFGNKGGGGADRLKG